MGKDGANRRLLALAAIYDGGTRTEAAQIGGVGLQTVRDWVLRFNVHGRMGFWTAKPRVASILSEEHRQHLVQMIEDGPIAAVHGVVRWRLVDLMQWLWEEYQITDLQADAESGGARPRLPQALSKTTASCPDRAGGDGRF